MASKPDLTGALKGRTITGTQNQDGELRISFEDGSHVTVPLAPTYHGVDIQQLPPGAHPVVGVATSIAMFVGRASLGPLAIPVLCWSYADFVHTFSEDTSAGQLADYVRLFFMNGGTQCYVMRIANGATGDDGTSPLASDYDQAYAIIDKQVDLFNLLVLPRNEPMSVTLQSLYGAASLFCEKHRALLIMDPPESWQTVEDATDLLHGVNSLRVDLSSENAALYFPCVTISDQDSQVNIGPAGAIAGLIARTDRSRGVWKAPAGIEAALQGIVGLQHQLSDSQNEVLNRSSINALRHFPAGTFSWGARTMAGDDASASDYKYISVRRLALFLEENLSRGLEWAVFEPNDEPLWAQIRLNVGAFMLDLFQKGAFQGRAPREAFVVRCDGATTTPADQNRGVVNILVGFAPLKPAEFLILFLQLMARPIPE